MAATVTAASAVSAMASSGTSAGRCWRSGAVAARARIARCGRGRRQGRGHLRLLWVRRRPALRRGPAPAQRASQAGRTGWRRRRARRWRRRSSGPAAPCRRRRPWCGRRRCAGGWRPPRRRAPWPRAGRRRPRRCRPAAARRACRPGSPVRGADHGQVLHRRLDVGAPRAEAGVDPAGGDEADQELPPVGRHDQAGGSGHRVLERTTTEGASARVEQDRRPPLPRHLVLAHHQLVPAGGGGPVDPAQVVALGVGAQRVEVLTGGPEGVRVVEARPWGSSPWVWGSGVTSSTAGHTVRSAVPAARVDRSRCRTGR
jgi:hypothetical protein